MNCTDIVALTPLYLSGELDAPRTAVFAAHLKACPACTREVEQQTEFDAGLRMGVLAEEIDSAAVDRRIREHIGTRRHRRWMVAAAVVVLAGILGYRAFLGAGTPQACTDAARDHRLEVVDHQPRSWVTDRAEIEALAESRGLSAAVVGALTGYRLERGKLCRLDGRPFLHLIYTDGVQEFSVFLRQRDAGETVGLYTADLGHEHVASFQTDRMTALVVSDQSREAALQLGRFAASVL